MLNIDEWTCILRWLDVYYAIIVSHVNKEMNMIVRKFLPNCKNPFIKHILYAAAKDRDIVAAKYFAKLRYHLADICCNTVKCSIDPITLIITGNIKIITANSNYSNYYRKVNNDEMVKYAIISGDIDIFKYCFAMVYESCDIDLTIENICKYGHVTMYKYVASTRFYRIYGREINILPYIVSGDNVGMFRYFINSNSGMFKFAISQLGDCPKIREFINPLRLTGIAAKRRQKLRT